MEAAKLYRDYSSESPAVLEVLKVAEGYAFTIMEKPGLRVGLFRLRINGLHLDRVFTALLSISIYICNQGVYPRFHICKCGT